MIWILSVFDLKRLNANVILSETGAKSNLKYSDEREAYSCLSKGKQIMIAGRLKILCLCFITH